MGAPVDDYRKELTNVGVIFPLKLRSIDFSRNGDPYGRGLSAHKTPEIRVFWGSAGSALYPSTVHTGRNFDRLPRRYQKHKVARWSTLFDDDPLVILSISSTGIGSCAFA